MSTAIQKDEISQVMCKVFYSKTLQHFTVVTLDSLASYLHSCLPAYSTLYQLAQITLLVVQKPNSSFLQLMVKVALLTDQSLYYS